MLTHDKNNNNKCFRFNHSQKKKEHFPPFFLLLFVVNLFGVFTPNM